MSAKLSARMIRAAGRGGGTALPGRVALWLDPALPGRLVEQLPGGVVIVTGTNGKTTTSRMLVHLLSEQGLRVVANRAGANLKTGIAATLVHAGSAGGRLAHDVAVLEVDERSVPNLFEQTSPRAVLVTNLFRDQLDRAGEPALILKLLRGVVARLGSDAIVVLNADDPTVAGLADVTRARVCFYGIEAPPPKGAGGRCAVDDVSAGAEETPDADMCLACGVRFVYKRLYYAHLGHYRCPNCGRRRPDPEARITALAVSGAGHVLDVALPAGRSVKVHLELPGLYNAYNALAAVALCHALGRSLPREITLGAESAAFGRMEPIAVDGRTLVLALVKNPTGAQESIEAILQREHFGHLAFALNDNDADGRDVSWVWDIHLERLAGRHDLRRVTVCGTRAADMAVRFKYAGFDENKLYVVPEIERAIDSALAAVPQGGELALLVTYTALLQARQLLSRRGLVRPFWEG